MWAPQTRTSQPPNCKKQTSVKLPSLRYSHSSANGLRQTHICVDIGTLTSVCWLAWCGNGKAKTVGQAGNSQAEAAAVGLRQVLLPGRHLHFCLSADCINLLTVSRVTSFPQCSGDRCEAPLQNPTMVTPKLVFD
jgi:hypothetical protein